MRKHCYPSLYQLVSVILLLLVVAGVGIYLIVSPKQSDDYWFGMGFKWWFEANGLDDINCGWEVLRSGFPHEDILRSWWDHIRGDCGRIANPVMMYFLCFPKWVASGVVTGFWALCMFCSLRLANVSLRQTWIVAVAVFFWSFQVAWPQRMEDLAYQFNYIVSGGLMIWYIWWIYSRKFSVWVVIVSLLTGTLIGAWHEGFTVPVLVGGLVVILLYKRYRAPKYMIAMIALAIGVTFLILCPGFRIRMNAVHEPIKAPLLFTISAILGNTSYFIVLIWSACRVLQGGLKKITPLIVFALAGGAVAFVLQFISVNERRVSWWTGVISIVALMQMLRNARIKPFHNKEWIKWGIVAISGSLSVAHWVAVDYYTILYAREFREVLTALKNGNSKYVFLKLRPPGRLPLICAWTPNMELYHRGWNRETLNEYYYGYDYSKYIYFLPEAMRNVTAITGNAVSGGSGIREVEGYMYCEVSQIEFKPKTLDYLVNSDIMMSTGLKGEGTMWITKFVSEADGKEYFYLEPNEANIKVLFGDIIRIENLRSCW